MEDGEQEGLRIALHSDNRIIMATTLATIVLAGSAFLWRSSSNKMIPTHAALQQPDAPIDPDARVMSTSDLEGQGQIDREDTSQEGLTGAHFKVGGTDSPAPEGDMKDSKSVRSKERRRRRKDPLKEMLKASKKLKGSPRPSKLADHSDESGATTPTTLSKPRDSTRQTKSRDTSLPPSSRSVSRSASSTSSGRRTPFPGDADQPSYGSPGEVNVLTVTPTLPVASSSRTEDGGILERKTTRAGDVLLSASSTDTSAQLHDVFYEPPALSLSLSVSSASSSSSTGASSEAVLTPGTSPDLSLSENTMTPTLIHPSQSLPASVPLSTVKNLGSPPSNTQSQLSPGPWDWDGAGESSMSHKPPRFRPTSRGSSIISPLLPSSTSMPAPPASASFSLHSPAAPPPPLSLSLSSMPSGELPLSFPTLNATATSTTSPSPSPSRNHSNTGLHGNGFDHAANGDNHINGATKRVITPRRAPTPLSGTSTPPPSVSAQTQIASLKGALEAARMREEKMKSEMERFKRELEVLRWEGVAWRRREVEFQTHIHHLMHQLQAYAALFAAVPPLSPLNTQHHVNGNNSGHNPASPNGSQSVNGYPHPLPAPQSPQTHIISPNQMFPPNGFLSPTSMLSPASAHSGPHNPFFTYPSHIQQQQPQPQTHAQPSPHQSNLFSMLFPHVPPVGTSGSSASSIAGSSAGSLSPELGDPMSPGSDRGRKQTRAVNGRMDGGTWEGDGDGWIGVTEEDGAGGRSESDDEDAPLNGLLADAILKRPGSIRAASKRGKAKEKEMDKEEKPTEFVFPSLSDWGNVHRDGSNHERVLEGKPLTPTSECSPKPTLALDLNCTGDGPHASDTKPSTLQA